VRGKRKRVRLKGRLLLGPILLHIVRDRIFYVNHHLRIAMFNGHF